MSLLHLPALRYYGAVFARSGRAMLRVLSATMLRTSVSRDADRLITCHGWGALAMARRAARASGEDDRNDYWHKVVRQIERRLNYRPF